MIVFRSQEPNPRWRYVVRQVAHAWRKTTQSKMASRNVHPDVTHGAAECGNAMAGPRVARAGEMEAVR